MFGSIAKIRKSTLTLVTLPSFSISGEISAEKMLKVEKCTDVCMTGGMHYTPSHTNVCKFYNFQLTFFPGGGGVLPNMGYIGMCGPKG